MIKNILCTATLLITLSNFADDKITTKIQKIDKDKDGKVELIIKTTFRGKEKILREVNRKNLNFSNMRNYYIDNKIKYSEEDHDYDGIYEIITIHSEIYSKFEVFNREKDGTITPVKAKTLEKRKNEVKKIYLDAKEYMESEGLETKDLDIQFNGDLDKEKQK